MIVSSLPKVRVNLPPGIVSGPFEPEAATMAAPALKTTNVRAMAVARDRRRFVSSLMTAVALRRWVNATRVPAAANTPLELAMGATME
jgi:hypothetical protein